jgi:hypothetical protein
MALSNAGTSVSNSFVTMFSDDVKQAYQQSSSNLVGAVRVVRNVVGSTYKFHKLSKGGSIKNKNRYEDITAMSDTSKSNSGTYVGGTAQNSIVTTTLNNFHSGEYVDDMDQFKTNIDLRSTFASAIASALGRAVDQEIIDALDAGSPTTTVSAGSGLTKEKFLEIHEAMNALDVPTEGRAVIISPQALTDLLTDSNLVTAADGLVSNTALASGYIPNVFGFNVIMSTLLTKNSVQRDCYAIHRDSVGLALAADINTRIDYVPAKASHLILGTMSGGSTVIDADGVVKVEVTE